MFLFDIFGMPEPEFQHLELVEEFGLYSQICAAFRLRFSEHMVEPGGAMSRWSPACLCWHGQRIGCCADCGRQAAHGEVGIRNIRGRQTVEGPIWGCT